MNEISLNSGSIEEIISFLSKQDVQSRKNRSNTQTSLALQTLENISRKEGLKEEQIIKLVDLASCGIYADSIATRLVKSLIPSGRVPSIAIVKAISWICTNKLSINQQALLLRWILVVYKLIDDTSHLHSLYGIIFLFLESDILCPHICLLLSYLSTREDVKHFRIKKLLSLQNRVGSQPHLSGLLSVYKMYCPDLISMATSSRKVWFKQKDKAWEEAIHQVQEKQELLVPVERLFLEVRGPQTGCPKPKRRRAGNHTTIPSPHSMSTVGGVSNNTDDVKISIQQLSSFDDLLENIDNIELPGQIASMLESPFLQHIVSCSPDYVTLQRLNFWLNHTLFEQFLSSSSSGQDPFDTRLLKTLIQLTSFLQESVPATETWLVKFLFSWNGVDCRPLVLKLVTQLSLHPFSKLHDLVLEPLRKLFFSSSVYYKCQVVYCFTELLRNFVTVELPRQQELQQQADSSNKHNMTSCVDSNGRSRDMYKDQRKGKDQLYFASKDNIRGTCVSIFVDEETSLDPLKTVYEYIQYVDRLCVVALQAEGDHVLLQHCVLNFFELVSVLQTKFSVPFVVIPSPGVVYRLLFANNSMACSRLCQIIVNYKNSFESLKKSPTKTQTSVPDSFQSIQKFNQYILDTCDSLWRNKAFVDREKSGCFTIASSVADELDVRHMNEAFSIHNHVALVGFAWTFLKQTQPEDLSLTPRLIKGRVRQAYLEYLRRRGLQGIIVFLETFIRHKF